MESMRTSEVGNLNKGFTLIETTVVLFILALTMGLVLPEVVNMLQGDPLRATVNRVISAVAQARSQAMLDRDFWSVVIDTGGGFENGQSSSIDKKNKKIFLGAGKGARFRDIVLIPTRKVFTHGRVALVFQPNGLTEPVLVHCESSEGQVTTLYLKAFNPRPVITDGDRALESLLGGGAWGESTPLLEKR